MKMLGTAHHRLDANKGTMSMRAITARFTDKPVKFDDAEERRVLTTLKMIYEGGSLDGKIADLPTRDLSSVVVGLHRGNWHFFETYKRTIHVNLRNRRTIFRYAGLISKSNNTCWWKKLLAVLHVRKRKAIIIPALIEWQRIGNNKKFKPLSARSETQFPAGA
jgi:hypothetical protein